MAFYQDETHFRVFAAQLEAAIAKYGDLSEESLLERQRRQLKHLIGLENQFRKTLIRHPWGPSVYKAFVSMILDKKRNILAARPYFRERQNVFAAQISRHLKKRSDRGLYKFRFNYSFVQFVLSCHKWPAGGKIQKIARQIDVIRREIMEMNLPLAISQARIFWSNTPRSHLSYMDLVQIHCGGLLVAIDKFVPPDTRGMSNANELEVYRKFRAVAIGRMIGDRIEQYSETLIHYYPVDKRKIYRANKALRRGDAADMEKVAAAVNEDVDDKSHRTTAVEIAQLLASASTVSGDVAVELDGETTLERYADEEDFRPDRQVEEADAKMAVKMKIRDPAVLNVKDKKILRMRHIQ